MDHKYRRIPSRFRWNAQRFLNMPALRLPHTYIGDVDILILDSDIEAVHADHCRALSLPYSNVVRPNLKRLSGLHFVKTDPYFGVITPDFVSAFLDRFVVDRDAWTDEDMLYGMMEASFGLPLHADPTVAGFRPSHGIHLCRHRTPTGNPGWGIAQSRIRKFHHLKEDDRWTELVAACDAKYLELLQTLESEIRRFC
jgi:hypothetical protein